MTFEVLVDRIATFIINPIIVLLVVLALFLFFWGLAQFILNAGDQPGKDDKKGSGGRETGKRHMLWGIIGLFIILSVFGILRILVNTFDIGSDPDDPVNQIRQIR